MEVRTKEREIPSERREIRQEPVREVRTEPTTRVTVTAVERDDNRERRKAKGKQGLLMAAAVVLAATLLTMGATWHVATRAKQSVQAGIEGIENLASKGKETLFGKSHEKSQFEDLGHPGLIDKAKATFGFGRHEALQKVREALGIESGKPMTREDLLRLEELIRLDQYSHSEGFWDAVKEKLGSQEEIAQKFRSALGIEKAKPDKLSDLVRSFGHQKESDKLRELLGLETGRPITQEALHKLKEAMGLDPDKPLSQEVMQKLKDSLGMEEHEPTLWEKTKAKITGSDIEKPEQDTESILEKVKDTVGLGKDKTEKLIKEAKHRTSETEDLLNRAYQAERKKERSGGR